MQHGVRQDTASEEKFLHGPIGQEIRSGRILNGRHIRVSSRMKLQDHGRSLRRRDFPKRHDGIRDGNAGLKVAQKAEDQRRSSSLRILRPVLKYIGDELKNRQILHLSRPDLQLTPDREIHRHGRDGPRGRIHHLTGTLFDPDRICRQDVRRDPDLPGKRSPKPTADLRLSFHISMVPNDRHIHRRPTLHLADRRIYCRRDTLHFGMRPLRDPHPHGRRFIDQKNDARSVHDSLRILKKSKSAHSPQNQPPI